MARADAPAAAAVAALTVEVVYCAQPHEVWQRGLVLAAGSTLADALRASGVLEAFGLDGADVQAGVWGKPRPAEHPLREGDRVELYRGLRVDPKEARRQRYRQHRERSAR